MYPLDGMNDISEDPTNKEKVKFLFTELLQLQKDMDDPLDLPNIHLTIN